ncbi:PAS/PAC sensor signal transduction histidine kinase [Calothrix sp. NIES-4071]|nr:PAS/PAC sensor signal transduction histidine kinase [Calothrix sp. NIES-4071]BAZ58549.1 PAS/PAC sensor signal transduction histidine kinase [Calothrix sp. NIES-4105]
MDRFARQINAVQRRTETLNQSLAASSRQPGLLVQAFNQLHDALEELQVTHNELLLQKEQLADCYRSAELERQRYRNSFDFAPDAYLITDRDGNIVDANRAAANLFQLRIQSYNAWANKSLLDFLPQDQQNAFHYQLLRLPHEQTLKDWEVVFCKKDGQTFPATISVNTVKNLNDEIHFYWLIRDITARKQAEEAQAIKSENLQLQETVRLKSQFMAMMSHELRTPMHIILGFAQLLLRQPVKLLAPQLKNMVERIYNNAKHLLALIEDILDFTALESGKLSLNSQQFNLAELIQSVTQELQHLASRKQLPLVVDIKLQNPTIIGDSERIRQILVNLLDNAIKFTDKGSVTLEAYEMPFCRIAIVVRDTGIGIAESDIKCIFQEFRQVNQTYCRTHGGTGLGLAIVDKLLKLIGGTISVESELGEGSTFRVELPRGVESALVRSC